MGFETEDNIATLPFCGVVVNTEWHLPDLWWIEGHDGYFVLASWETIRPSDVCIRAVHAVPTYHGSRSTLPKPGWFKAIAADSVESLIFDDKYEAGKCWMCGWRFHGNSVEANLTTWFTDPPVKICADCRKSIQPGTARNAGVCGHGRYYGHESFNSIPSWNKAMAKFLRKHEKGEYKFGITVSIKRPGQEEERREM